MREATQQDIPAILIYLKRHVQSCLYMYIDIGKYGLDNPNLRVWLDEDNRGIKLVVMKYHSSISVYTDDKEWDADAVAQLIQAEQVGSVTAEKSIIERLHPLCGAQYAVTYGAVFRFKQIRSFELEERIEPASEADTPEIARLITQDEEIGSYYEVDDLAEQLAERMRTKMGRSFVIRDNGEIIAHIASYAEYDGLATTGGLIVKPECRNGLYGGALESHLLNTLLKENFRVYTFVTERLRKRLLSAWGNECVGEYGKMTHVTEGA